MGRFSNLKDKLADARDSVQIKILEAQADREKKKEENFEKTRQKFLERVAKDAHRSGLPATLFENGQWYTFYPDGRKVPMCGTQPAVVAEKPVENSGEQTAGEKSA